MENYNNSRFNYFIYSKNPINQKYELVNKKAKIGNPFHFINYLAFIPNLKDRIQSQTLEVVLIDKETGEAVEKGELLNFIRKLKRDYELNELIKKLESSKLKFVFDDIILDTEMDLIEDDCSFYVAQGECMYGATQNGYKNRLGLLSYEGGFKSVDAVIYHLATIDPRKLYGIDFFIYDLDGRGTSKFIRVRDFISNFWPPYGEQAIIKFNKLNEKMFNQRNNERNR